MDSNEQLEIFIDCYSDVGTEDCEQSDDIVNSEPEDTDVEIVETQESEEEKLSEELAEHFVKKRGVTAKCKHCPILKKSFSGNRDKGGHPVWSNLTRHLKVRFQ